MGKVLDENVILLKIEIMKKAKLQGRILDSDVIYEIPTDRFLEMIRSVELNNEQLHLLVAIYGIDGGETMTPEQYATANHLKPSKVDQCWRETLRVVTCGIRDQISAEQKLNLYDSIADQVKSLTPHELQELQECITELSIICALGDLDHNRAMTVQEYVPIGKVRNPLSEKFRRAFMRLIDYPECEYKKDHAVENILRQLGPFNKNQLNQLGNHIEKLNNGLLD